MYQFTDNDIVALKANLWSVLFDIYVKEFDFSPYVEAKLITLQQCNSIAREVQKTYPDICLEPLPNSLSPLIGISKERVAKAKTAPPPKRRKTFFVDFDCDYEYEYEYKWDSDY